MPEFSCPLCRRQEYQQFYCDRRRSYHRCSHCALIFVAPESYLSAEAEKAEYDRHQNYPQDESYRRFLSRLLEPLLQCIPARQQGLDFGCGPGPVLAQMLTEAGHQVALYDIFYHPDTHILQEKYDFICATEVVEHLHNPGVELENLWACLKPGGVLGLMTKLALDADAFARWHYKNDPTHVCFFSRTTFAWLAETLSARVEFIGSDVILLHKPLTC